MSVPLSKEWIRQQLRLCEKATPGPWVYQKHLGCKNIGPRDGIRKIHGVLYTSGLSNNVEDRANARLCVAAREGYPLVLNKLQRLQERRCANCEFYAYYDGPLCGLNDVTDVGFLFPRDPDTWYCADWKSEEPADASDLDSLL